MKHNIRQSAQRRTPRREESLWPVVQAYLSTNWVSFLKLVEEIQSFPMRPMPEKSSILYALAWAKHEGLIEKQLVWREAENQPGSQQLYIEYRLKSRPPKPAETIQRPLS